MIYLFFLFALASELPGEELFLAEPKIEVNSQVLGKEVLATQSKDEKTRSKIRKEAVEVNRNLPSYFQVSNSSEEPVSELVMKPPGSLDIYRGLQVGDKLQAIISHSVIAFPEEKSPVIAIVDSGVKRGLRFIGYSTLEPNSRRIFINFDRVIANSQIFKIQSIGVTLAGQPGFMGKYHSREGEYFTGEFISSFVAGYFDELVPRKTNAFGQLENDNSVDSAVKKGLASGALSSADRFRDKLKKVPEFSELKGPIEITVLVLDQAKKE